MSSRYPSNDSRYTSRDRTPPRYTDRRASTTHGSSFVPRNDDPAGGRPYPDSIGGSASRDVPRGPKALADPTRGPPPGGAPSVPAGPRGRGFGARSEYRELRDAPPLSDGRGGSSWRGGDRDRHFDRRDRPLSPRARSPGRDSRDSRDSRDFGPRELDIDRARRSARDGPPSAGSNYSDPPSTGFGLYGRGGFGSRGRGRGGDWETRGRGRGSFADDRSSFRPRSRSPRPRWDKDSTRDDRITDRRDDRRFDRRDDDRPFYRDDRDADRYKRDPISSRDVDIRRASVAHDSRYGSVASSTSHQSPRHSSISVAHGSGVDRAGTADPPRELLPGRRASVAHEPLSAKDKPDYIQQRAEASRDRYGPRASSPPPQAPQVPAFGSVSSFPKPATTFTTPTSNVWRPPQPLQQATLASGPPSGPKAPPSAPKALSAVPPTAPTGPKATRMADKPAIEMQQANGPAVEQPRPKLEGTPGPTSQYPLVPTGPAAESHDALSRSRPPSPPLAPPLAPPTAPAALQQRSPAPAPPTGPRVLVSPQQPHTRLAPPALPPSAANIPIGPRASGPFSTSPRGPPPGPGPLIPTGPKAERGPPVAPRASLFPQLDRSSMNAPRPPMMGVPARNLQWIRPDAPRYPRGPGPLIPAKRDSEGDEKEKVVPTRPRSPAFAVGSPVSGPATPIPPTNDMLSQRRKSAGEIRSRDDGLDAFGARRNSAFTFSDKAAISTVKTEQDSPAPPPDESQARESQSSDATDEDDEMDLDDEEFFGQSKTIYERDKALLGARLKNLKDRNFRCATPLKTFLRLSRITEADLPQPKAIPAPQVPAPVENGEGTKQAEKDVEMADEELAVKPAPEIGEGKEAKPIPGPADRELELEPAKLLTPTAEEPDDVEMAEMAETGRAEEDGVEDEEASSDEESITEADLSSLPYLNRGPPTPLSDPDQESVGLKTNIMAAIKNKIFQSHQAEREFQDSTLQVFRIQYKDWGFEAAQREKEASQREEKEKTEEQEAAVPPGEPLALPGSVHRQRHVTDYDLENILRESRRMEEERIEKQRREEEARNPFSGGQASIPDMLPDEELERRKFVNTNRLREPGKGIMTFGFEPPEDEFTPEEHKALVAAFLVSPKDWGEIAKALPGRNFRDCINHYYATKWNGEYKPPTGRRKKQRKAGVPKGRNKTAIPFASTVPDPADGDEVVAATTERVRPRRAAAPTFGDRETQDPDQATPVPTPGRPRGASTRGETVEPSTERSVKRQRVVKEKGGRKGRAAQNLAPAPSASPQKMDRDVKDMYPGDGPMDAMRMPRTDEEAAMFAAPRGQSEMPVSFGDGAFQPPGSAPAAVERPKPRGQNSRAGGMSSYWSVNESTDFRNYLGYFGTDFAGIARQMGTKTPAMVKNEYCRKTDSGSHPELVEIAQAADERRKRGEDLGPPPPPTASTKRRYDTSQPTVPRTLAPTPTEAMEVQHSPTQTELPRRTASPHVQQLSRFPPLAQAGSAMPTSAPQQPVMGSAGTPAQNHHAHSYARSSQHEMPGPRRGYFDQRDPPRSSHVQSEVRQPQPESVRDVRQEHHHRRQYSQGVPGHQQIQEQQYARLPSEHREREVQSRQQPETFTSAIPHQAMYRTSMPQQQIVRDARSDPPTPSNAEQRPAPMQQSAFPPHQAPTLRHLVETPTQLPVAQAPGRMAVSRPASPAREEIQQPYVPAPSVSATPRPAPAEPRKTSNLADLLNPAPSEPAPPKPKEQKPADDRASMVPPERPYSAQGRPIHQTTAPPPMSSSSPAYPRRELYAGSPTPRSPFARSAYIQQQQQSQHMQAPPQRRPMSEMHTREQSQPPPARDHWPSRQSFSQSSATIPQTSSPHLGAMQPQQALSMDTRQQFGGHRAALSQLNTHSQPRGVHSPTPSHTPHSRTPSYSHPQPPQRQQAPTPLQQLPGAPSPAREASGPVLTSNPYTQLTPPQSVQQPVPPSQVQQQMQQQMRNEQGHVQNRALSFSQPAYQAHESMIERERALRLEQDRQREHQLLREREAQAAQQHSREAALIQQHYMRQPTPSQADQVASRFSSAGPGVPQQQQQQQQQPSRNAHTPTGHMGYPPPPQQPPTHHALGQSQEQHPHHHGFGAQVPSAAQRGLEALNQATMRRHHEAQAQQQQQQAHHAQAQAAHHAHAHAHHREQRYREEVAAAAAAHHNAHNERLRHQHEELVSREMERERMDRERIDRQRMEEWDRQGRNIFGGRDGRGGLFGPNPR